MQDNFRRQVKILYVIGGAGAWGSEDIAPLITITLITYYNSCVRLDIVKFNGMREIIFFLES